MEPFKTLRNILLALFLTTVSVPFAFAAEGVVLLPVTGPLTPQEINTLTTDAAKNLSGRFRVIYGEEVDAFVKKVFSEESKKADCDEDACYRRIAANYKVDRIAALKVAKMGDKGYLVTFSIYDTVQGKVIESRRKDCADCSFEGLQALCSGLVADRK